ncbi:MAG: hypothetical protein GDA54_05560 [Alphaproteobacteria bacterium GM7ARS4]|nr:hypothetical protein [Alphaproteobacteria bacterium GM7ARS4]
MMTVREARHTRHKRYPLFYQGDNTSLLWMLGLWASLLASSFALSERVLWQTTPSAELAVAAQHLDIALDEKGIIHIDGVAKDVRLFRQELEHYREEGSSEMLVRLFAYPQQDYGRIMQILGLIKEAGFRRMVLVSLYGEGDTRE